MAKITLSLDDLPNALPARTIEKMKAAGFVFSTTERSPFIVKIDTWLAGNIRCDRHDDGSITFETV